jgi:hypothetical protein
MATIDTDTLQSTANLSLWYKVRSGDALVLADVPEMIPLRWAYFRDSWQVLRRRLVSAASSYSDPDYFRACLDDLDTFIEQQRLSTIANNPFSGSATYYRFYPVFDSMPIEQISLTHEERDLLSRKRRQVSAFTKTDFLKIKRDITAYRDYLADSVGLADQDYNRVYDRGAAASQVAPTAADMNLMLVLQEQLNSVNFILANLFAVDAAVDPFALAKLNANNPDVAIGEYKSGYLVKLNFGEDLQGLATRYLGDPNRWIDIAIANGLREPYVDEIGEQLFFLANGRGSQINMRAVDSSGRQNINKFYINQLAFIQSAAVPFPSQRLITDIKEVPVSGEIILTLSGDANLDAYRLADQASIRIFKPSTVNSSQYVLIPTPASLDNTRSDEIPWFQVSSPADEKKTKIDMAIGDDGKLLLTPNGDVALSYGLANGIQAVKLKLMAERGSNRYHPTFGLVNIIGSANTDETDAKNALITSISEQIQADPRFDRIESLSVERNLAGSAVAYNINLVVRLAGSNTLIPISFTVAT